MKAQPDTHPAVDTARRAVRRNLNTLTARQTSLRASLSDQFRLVLTAGIGWYPPIGRSRIGAWQF